HPVNSNAARQASTAQAGTFGGAGGSNRPAPTCSLLLLLSRATNPSPATPATLINPATPRTQAGSVPASIIPVCSAVVTAAPIAANNPKTVVFQLIQFLSLSFIL